MERPAADEVIGHLLFAAHQAFARDLVARLHGAGYPDIRPAHASVFANLDLAGTRASVLARRAGMSKVAMGKLIRDLEQKGYLARSPDSRDRRAKLVVLTPKGQRHMEDARRVIAAIGADYAGRLGPDRLSELAALLEALIAAPPPDSLASGAREPSAVPD